jgi:dienelactone hydrolase
LTAGGKFEFMTRRVLAFVLAFTVNPSAQSPVPAIRSLGEGGPLFELPAPTGKSAVGTTRWVVTDTSREETFAPGRNRDIEIVAWYPRAGATGATGAAGSTGATAPYLRDGMEEVLSFARLAKLGDAFNGLASVRTHATLDAEPARTPARFPVILFQHGYTGLPSSHTALMEDLASHGWAVLNLIHPYEATGAMLADGTVVTFTDEKNAMRAGITDVLNEWGPEGGTMEKITAAADDAEKEKLMRGYLAALKNTDQVVRRWTLDAKYALDHLPTTGAAGAIAARMDLSRLGAAGHSMGGVAGAQFCVEDRRCKAALNLDGIPQYGTMIDTPMPAPFLMVYSGRAGRAGASDIIYKRAASKYYRVDVSDTLHLDFTDMNFWGGPLRQRGAYGKIDPARAAEVTRTIVREFFGQEILNQPSALLSGKQPLSGVTVVELRKP